MELVMIVATIAVLVGLMLPALSTARAKAQRVTCVGHLVNIGLSLRIFATDNKDNFPMEVSTNKGGSKEFSGSPEFALRTFTSISNELSTPLILVCPADSRTAGSSWLTLSNANISYFLGVNAIETRPTMLLGGDRNITNGISPTNGFLDLKSNILAGWAPTLHKSQGNILFADSSVQQTAPALLRQTLIDTRDATNKIALPGL